LRPSGFRQQLEFGERVRGTYFAASGPYADQNHPLQPKLAVFDLADVGELGGHACHATQRQPILQGLLVSVVTGFIGCWWFEPLDEQLVI